MVLDKSYRDKDTVASEKDGFMSETISEDRNLPNSYLFELLFYSCV